MTHTPLHHRDATLAELVEHLAPHVRWGWKVRFRHFMLELYAPHARNGVQHKQYSNAKVKLIDGVPHVRHHGKVEPLAATAAEGPTFTKPMVYDVRLASPYLRGNAQ